MCSSLLKEMKGKEGRIQCVSSSLLTYQHVCACLVSFEAGCLDQHIGILMNLQTLHAVIL